MGRVVRVATARPTMPRPLLRFSWRHDSFIGDHLRMRLGRSIARRRSGGKSVPTRIDLSRPLPAGTYNTCLMVTNDDPRALAQRRFATPDHCVDLITIAERYATDASEVVRTLLDALRPQRGREAICELGFGSGWLLEEMAREDRDCRLVGLDLSPGMADHVQQRLGGRVDLLLGHL